MSPINSAVLLLAGLTCVLALGSETTIDKFPSVVQIEDRIALWWVQQCVGTVLTSYHILSAASCFAVPEVAHRNRRIRAGTTVRAAEGVLRDVIAVDQHPSYNADTRAGDIAVIRLASPLVFGTNVQQGMILAQGTNLPAGLKLIIASWGKTAGGGTPDNTNLFNLDLVSLTNEKCSGAFEDLVADNIICSGVAGSEGRDLDSRDAGASLFYSDITVGVVSFGVPSSDNKVPILSTAVSSYTNWIVEKASIV